MPVPARIRLLRTLSSFLLLLLMGCAANPPAFNIVNSLPPDRLAFYSDAFDTFREDLWKKSAFIYNDRQMTDFQLADMSYRGGKLVITTQKDCFSKAGLSTKYALKGDFDIQMDCRFSPLGGLQPMDQVMGLIVFDKGSGDIRNLDFVSLSMTRGLGKSKTFLMSNARNRAGEAPNAKEILDFDGSLRVLRIGRTISTYYRQKGAAWKKSSAFPLSTADLTFGFAIQNFTSRTSILKSAVPFTTEFSGFRINAAQGILEEEI